MPSSQPGKVEPIPLRMDDEFRRRYPTTPNKVLAKQYAVTTGTVLR